MNLPVLTIAIPAYNMEKYLGRCLDSVLKINTEISYEIIIINDGSKDNTLSIAKDYTIRYADKVKLIDKANGGWGSAINLAIKEARGKYFKILDSDDWFDTNEFIKYISLLQGLNVDLVATSFNNVYENGNIKNNVYAHNLCGKTIKFEDYLTSVKCNRFLPMATMTYRTSILYDNNIQVVDKYYADIDYNLTPLMYVKHIYFSQLNVYQYYIGREGQSTSLDGYRKHLIDYINVGKKEITFYEKNKELMSDIIKQTYCADIKNIIRFIYELLMSSIYESNDCNRKELLKSFDCYLKDNSSELYKKSNWIKKKSVPFIYIWRLLGINLLSIK